MRLVLSISEKAARALRVLAAEQGHRGVSAFVESVYGGDPPVAVHKASMLAAVMEQIAAQGPGLVTDCGFGPGPFLIDSERAKELTQEEAIVQEEGTLGDGHE